MMIVSPIYDDQDNMSIDWARECEDLSVIAIINEEGLTEITRKQWAILEIKEQPFY